MQSNSGTLYNHYIVFSGFLYYEKTNVPDFVLTDDIGMLCNSSLIGGTQISDLKLWKK